MFSGDQSVSAGGLKALHVDAKALCEGEGDPMRC